MSISASYILIHIFPALYKGTELVHQTLQTCLNLEEFPAAKEKINMLEARPKRFQMLCTRNFCLLTEHDYPESEMRVVPKDNGVQHLDAISAIPEDTISNTTDCYWRIIVDECCASED